MVKCAFQFCIHLVRTSGVISMLSSPNAESPANVEAAKQLREDYSAFKRKVQRMVEDSQLYMDSDDE
jgi:ubiquitin-conjugating enzyme E2 G1